jgi:pentatricopeptide repeat protein
VQLAWPKIVHELGITPDEGLCIDVLHTVARHGLPDLGTDVLNVIKRIGATWQEHHLASMIEAFCKADRLKEAFETLHVMRENGIMPVTETAHPVFNMIKQNISTIDGTWDILDQLREEGKCIDIAAINVVIQATAFRKDLQRAIGAYKSIPDYELQPNTDTFNLLLSACIDVGHRDLGDHLLGEMKAAAIKPDVQTYERLIILCLTQATYEDAFFYLEEMKGHKFLPTVGIYDAIIRKCVSVGDSRYNLALEEMEQCGYPVSRDLADFIKHGGAYEAPRDVGMSNSNGEEVVDLEPPPS